MNTSMFDMLSALLLVFLRFAAIRGSNRIATHPRQQQQQKQKQKDFPPGFYVIRPERYFLRGLLPQKDYSWFVPNIPFLDFPEDNDILTAYYYRWQMYKKHIRFVEDKNIFVVTEFLPEVPWAGQYNTIPAAAGHHIMEGRWIHDERILNDYTLFWFSEDTTRKRTGGGSKNESVGSRSSRRRNMSRSNATTFENSNLSSYTNWIGYASWQRYILNGNTTFVTSLLDSLATVFREIYVPKYLKEILWDGTSSNAEGRKQQVLQCWWQNDGYDAMEVSISGNGCRPTIASVMYGEAETVVKLSELLDQHGTDGDGDGDGYNKNGNENDKQEDLRKEFTEWREMSRSLILDYHWNSDLQTFSVIPTVFDAGNNVENTTRTVSSDGHGLHGDSDCDLSSVRVPNRTVHVRELLAFIPWYFESLIPKDRRPEYLPMWKELFDANGFAGEWGLRTAELRHPCYNYSYDHGDCWNGPSWPYETSRVLTGLANLLHHEDDGTAVVDDERVGQYVSLLRQYARQHTQTFAVNDTAVPKGSGHVFENLHADLGYWNNRQRMYARNDENKNMGDDYNHSTFIDLILSGLIGIRPQEDGSIHVHPLVSPSSVSCFAVDHVKVRGKILTVVWDRDGTMYERVGQGLTVLLNGTRVAHSATIELLVVVAAVVDDIFVKEEEEESRWLASSIARTKV